MGWEDLLAKGLATHFSIFFLGNTMNRGAWWATIHGLQRFRQTEQPTHFQLSYFICGVAAAAAESLQSCLTLCIAHQAPLSLGFSRQEYWSGLPFPSLMHACMLSRFSRVRLHETSWTAAHQAPLSMGFSRQEHWSGLPFPSPLYMGYLSMYLSTYSSEGNSKNSHK